MSQYEHAMDTREPLAEVQQRQPSNKSQERSESDDVVPRLVSRIKELEQKLYGSHFLRNIFDAPGDAQYPSLKRHVQLMHCTWYGSLGTWSD